MEESYIQGCLETFRAFFGNINEQAFRIALSLGYEYAINNPPDRMKAIAYEKVRKQFRWRTDKPEADCDILIEEETNNGPVYKVGRWNNDVKKWMYIPRE